MTEGALEEAVSVEEPKRRPEPDWDAMTNDQLAEARGVRPITSLDELAVDFFRSDEEMEEFIAYTYACRRRDLA